MDAGALSDMKKVQLVVDDLQMLRVLATQLA